MWKIRVNPAKSAHDTFTTRHVTCRPVFLHATQIPVKSEVKYLGLQLDRKLTWRKHIQTKRQHLDLKVQAPRSTLPTLPLKQTSPLQMYPQARVDMRNSAMGLCEALSHANSPTLSVQNLTHPCQRAQVCL
jgi:hypothetical protein